MSVKIEEISAHTECVEAYMGISEYEELPRAYYCTALAQDMTLDMNDDLPE